jgi:pyruvate-formate lyase
MDDCIERGRGILDGGARYNGACIMGHGFTNAADGLTAIRKLVFEERSVSLDEIRRALRDNFEGHADLHKRLRDAPKFGNDIAEPDTMLKRLWQEISRLTAEAGERAGLDFFTVSSVNPGGYFMGAQCGATPDGRVAGAPFAIGNAPTAGADTQGITAMLNSISRVDPANGGATTNVKLAKSMFAANRPKLEALFSTFWKHGGMQATLTVVSQAELEDAMEHPEKYPNLLVRVGGWSARFVDLEERIRRDVIRRTMY